MAELLERDAELARLQGALASAVDGRGRVVFVAGEAGIGKTSLVEAFVGGVEQPVRVAFGRCDALGTPRALGAFVDVAAALDVEAPADRDGLLGALVAAIRPGPPVMLVVEDAHWADDATVDLIALLGRRAVDLPLLFAVTYREEEVDTGHPLRLALGHLATASGAVWVGLAPLTLDAVRVLAEPTGASAERLHELTGGNPFYVTEALAAPEGTVPNSVRLAVLARASRLSPGARRVIDAAAVVPGRVEDWLLDALCRPVPGGLDECLSADVLLAARGVYLFRHELARQAIEGEIAPGERRELHRRAASALFARPGSDPARVAYHADRAGDDAMLARAGAVACRLAVARGAFREAIEHGERALAVSDQLSPDESSEVAVQLALALHRDARPEEAIVLAGRAVDHWRACGDGRREAEALNALGPPLVASGRTAEGTAAALRAVEVLEGYPSGPELAGAYTRLLSLHMLARDRDEAVEWGKRAVALAAELGDSFSLGRALIEYGIADVMDGRFEGLDRVRRGIDIGREHGLPLVVSHGLGQIGSGCGELRRYDLAIPALVEDATLTHDLGLEYGRQYTVSWLARCRFDLGQWDEAEALAEDVLGTSRTAGIARFVALNTLGWLRARRGDDDVWPVLDEALDLARRSEHLQRLWPCAVARAEAGWLEGELAPHVALLEEQLDLARRCRHHIAVGELGVWLRRAGRDPGPNGAEPFASWNRGDFAGAAAGFRSMGCPYEAASALAESGQTSSLREALATFDQLGAAPAAERVAVDLCARGVEADRAPRPAASSKPGGLSDREVEVLRLVAAGFTNPQIAATLYISRKTAEHHVSNILTKLGVASRSEAAAESVRLGITT